MTSTQPFWKEKTLDEMTYTEWESLCDGCGRCCLHKLEDDQEEDEGQAPSVWYTRVACRLLDRSTCRCTSYATRTQHVPACLDLHTVWDEAMWTILPPTCAYSLLARGEDLPAWHPLVAGSESSQAMLKARVPVSLFAVSELEVPDEDLELHIIDLETLELLVDEEEDGADEVPFRIVWEETP